jgi:hypothetical protein
MRKESDAMLSRQEVCFSYALFPSPATAKHVSAVATNIGSSMTLETMDQAGFMSTQ